MATQPLIAVVDDEAPVRTMLGRLLSLDGYRVVSFSNGEDVLASLAQQAPRCALLDIHMPDLSGFEVQARLKTLNADIPVVFITASDDLDLARKVDEVHGVALLRKPFSSRELSDAIQAALAVPRRDTS